MGLKKKRKSEPGKPKIRQITKAKRHMEWQDIPTNGKDTLLSTSIQFLGEEKEWGVMQKARSRGTWEEKKSKGWEGEKQNNRESKCVH